MRWQAVALIKRRWVVIDAVTGGIVTSSTREHVGLALVLFHFTILTSPATEALTDGVVLTCRAVGKTVGVAAKEVHWTVGEGSVG